MRKRLEHDEDIDEVPDNPVPEQDRPVRPPAERPISGESARTSNIKESRFRWAEAINYWQIANQEVAAKNFANAAVLFEESQKAVVRYFEKYYTDSPFNIDFAIDPNASLPEKVTKVVFKLWEKRVQFAVLWVKVRRRWSAVTLEELHTYDWASFYRAQSGWDVLIQDNDEAFTQTLEQRQQALDYFALILACVLIPLARAEMNRTRGNYGAAIEEYKRLLDPFQKSSFERIWFTSVFIERPFILLALGESLMSQGEGQFKRASQGTAGDARVTYQDILTRFSTHGAYTARVIAAQMELTRQADQLATLAPAQKELALHVLGQNVTVPKVQTKTKELPGLSQTKAPAESWLQLQGTVGGEVIAETNPRIYALLLHVQARLLQIDSGFNYLGYSNDYVPPWRFHYLLERARYFSEHAKSAQRDYLGFLNNAEHEGFQEQSAEQAVTMEKANVSVETARQMQVAAEYQAALKSKELADLTATDSATRLLNYQTFDKYADKQARIALRGAKKKAIASGLGGLIAGAASGNLGGMLGGLAGLVSGWGDEQQVGAQLRTADSQRAYEEQNLGLAQLEAQKAAEVAQKNINVAFLGTIAAGLQRQAALFRHEFAVQNLEYLGDRVLNAEQWMRLARAIRNVADTYLRYAVELGFLAEQAYEFEADKRINVMRFDYDQSEVGAYLAADFLLKDLDTLEQDYIVNQRQRQQEVRYVLSLAREFPEALEELRQKKKVNFLLRLEQIERRFPGLYNARIGMVDLLPIALMDSTRFSVDVIHTGNGQIRIKGQPDVPLNETSDSLLNTSDLPLSEYDWTMTPKELWPIKVLINEPETAIFSGLSRQDATSAFPIASTGQRNAFEGRGVAGGWRIDMSARDNQLVPESLSDLLITFTISGYHDAGLRAAIDGASRTSAVTGYLSGKQIFPDAIFDFHRSAIMTWNITDDLLAPSDSLGRVRNVAMLLLPKADNFLHFGRLMNRYQVRVKITDDNRLLVLSEIPRVKLDFADPMKPLNLKAKVSLPQLAGVPLDAKVSWSFGDGTPDQSGTDQEHLYLKPGRYIITLRVERNRRLTEFRAEVVASRNHTNELRPPVTIFPQVVRETAGEIPAGKTRIKCTAGGVVSADPVIVTWDIDQQDNGNPAGAKGETASFDLKPGEYTLTFTAVRQLKARVMCTQRLFHDKLINFDGLSLATNRRFDKQGNEVTGIENPQANDFVFHMYAEEFANSDFPPELSPVNQWAVEFPLANNSCLRSVSSTDVEQIGLEEIDDVVLVLEYETGATQILSLADVNLLETR